MKKFFAILISVLLISSEFTYAQTRMEKNGSNEISIEYGQFTAPQIAYTMSGIFGILFTVGNFTLDNLTYTGSVGVEYYHYLNNVLAVGGCVINDYMTADQLNKEGEYQGKFDADFLSIMPGLKAQWFNYRHFGMYSKANIGALLLASGNFDAAVAVQVSPVCCEFGGTKFRGFVEAGFGMQGVACAGIKYNL